MLNRDPQPMTVEALLAWQERQAEFFVSVDGIAFPARPRLAQDEPSGDAGG